jgi:hypothetical protein
MSKAVFVGIVRDCARYLPGVLGNLERLSACFGEVAFVFVENDSVDGTKALLRAWGNSWPDFTLFDLAGLGAVTVRTLRLEVARNTYLEFVRGDPAFASFDTLCILDMDDAGAYPIDLQEFKEALDFMKRTDHCAGVFANNVGNYYDMWALRHPELCPHDVWYEVFLWAQQHDASDQEAFDQTFAKRIRSFGRDMGPIEVDSAFGGIGVYNLDYVRRCPNPYLGSRVRVMRRRDGQVLTCRTEQCEHVHFHEGLRHLGGRLFILPGLINGIYSSDVTFPCSWYRNIIF